MHMHTTQTHCINDLGKNGVRLVGRSGSGRWKGNSKVTVEDCLALDCGKLVRGGLIKAGVHAYGNFAWSNAATGAQLLTCDFEINTLDLSFS